MSLIDKILNIGAGAPDKAGKVGNGKFVGKMGGESILFGSTLAKLGKDASKDVGKTLKEEVGIKKVKLSRGGLEVEISYPKSLLKEKGLVHHGKEAADPAILHELNGKKIGVKSQTNKKEKSSESEKDQKSEVNIQQNLENGAQKEVTGVEKVSSGKLPDSHNTKDKGNPDSPIGDHKKIPVKAIQVTDSDGKSLPKDKKLTESVTTAGPEVKKTKGDGHKGKNSKVSSGDDIKNQSHAVAAVQTVNSKGKTAQVGVTSKADQKGDSKSIVTHRQEAKTQADHSEQSKFVATGNTQSQPEGSTNLVEHSPEKGKSGLEPSKKLSNKGTIEKPQGKGIETDPAKLKTIKTAPDAPKVVRDRYYGQRVVKDSVQVNDVPKDKVEIKNGSKPESHGNHTLGTKGKTGTIENKSVNSPSSVERNKQHTGNNQNGQTPDQQASIAKARAEDTSNKISANDNKTVSRPQATQSGNNPASVATTAQINTPRMVAERIVSMVQKTPQSAQEQQVWHRHRLVMDNGQTLNVSARTSDGVLHLQLAGGNQDLNKLLQQHLQEIQNHLQEQMHVQVDLQFQNQSNGQMAQQFQQQQSGNQRMFNRAMNLNNDFDERTAESNERPLSNRRLGYNKTEWTA